MPKAIFTVRVNSTYDDLPEVKYHFPKTYLNFVKQAIGDWIVYYEPRRANSDPNNREGRQAYFATAKLTSISPDSKQEGHFYGFVSNYLEFDQAVPFREPETGKFYESGLEKESGKTNIGAFGRAVRHIGDSEYVAILKSGFFEPTNTENLIDHKISRASPDELVPTKRPLIEQVVTRPFRDHRFRNQVKQAYCDTCAFTGLKIINGGGRSEVQAAHIRPVKHNGPDSVRNGIALSATLHWIFDRGLISIDDDYKLLINEKKMPPAIMSMINPDRRALIPNSTLMAPHEQFMKYHRENIFKG